MLVDRGESASILRLLKKRIQSPGATQEFGSEAFQVCTLILLLVAVTAIDKGADSQAPTSLHTYFHQNLSLALAHIRLSCFADFSRLD